ncbi:hypothetical protein EV193_101792 [Herbihabitans rhizosphaerae]|uniref:Uncharacterized protein n=1 Tax=Herbihabitans rhizosphaerae TaxID=1872711 RepID=A0A4Q7L8D0_9PSEU|nr:hypothetical protein EV193_101792 [Herbihabitans rhizosphaerae]
MIAAALAAAGCSSTPDAPADPVGDADRALVRGYFERLNAAGAAGPAPQAEFLRTTQHPDFTSRLCELGALTVAMEPALSTLRPDPRWRPDGTAAPPRGRVYVLGVRVTVRRNGTAVGEQVGSQRVVVTNDTAYGFSPCLNR